MFDVFLHTVTTDVQTVTATLQEDKNASLIRCEFMTGSNAGGCRVILKSLFGDEELQIPRQNSTTNSATLLTLLKYPPACYYQVQAVDIESDGSNGTLAFPGKLMGFDKDKLPPCSHKQLPG